MEQEETVATEHVGNASTLSLLPLFRPVEEKMET